jgi:hypothetical protein
MKSKELRRQAANELRASRNGRSKEEKRNNRKRASAFKSLAENQQWLDGEKERPDKRPSDDARNRASDSGV